VPVLNQLWHDLHLLTVQYYLFSQGQGMGLYL